MEVGWGRHIGLAVRRFGLWFHPHTPGAISLLGFSFLIYKMRMNVRYNLLCYKKQRDMGVGAQVHRHGPGLQSLLCHT